MKFYKTNFENKKEITYQDCYCEDGDEVTRVYICRDENGTIMREESGFFVYDLNTEFNTEYLLPATEDRFMALFEQYSDFLTKFIERL